MLMSEASEGVGQPAIVTTHVHDMAEDLKSFPVVHRYPMSIAMSERSIIPRSFLENLMDVLRSGDADRPSP